MTAIANRLIAAAALPCLAGSLALPSPDPVPAPAAASEPGSTMRVVVDAAAEHRPISPLIYGASFADAATIRDLDLPLDRAGGDSASLYDWRSEARNAGRDWFFETLPIAPDDPVQYGARFVASTRQAGAAALVTVPMTGWAARLAPDGSRRAAFSVAKYGWQRASDRPGFPDAGNGIRSDGTPVTGNDPNDAARPSPLADQRAWIASLAARFGTADRGGVRFYAMDNEPSRWHDIHRDVRPIGLHAAELADRIVSYARMVKAVDPAARVLAPEEWGWNGYRYSGFDQQIGDAHGYRDDLPDRVRQTGGMDLLPWLLTRLRDAGRPVDMVSVHFYPQGGEYSDQGDDVSPAMQLRRNRSTRALWDLAYVDESWIADRIALLPRLRGWVDRYYRPGTPIAITEYSWGAERHMNGATAEADVLGIFGREGVALAARWATPAAGSPTYLAMKLFRNHDGQRRSFGETSIAARAPDPDRMAAFAALRVDGALTIIAINKQPDRPQRVALDLSHFAATGAVTGARLAKGVLAPLARDRYEAGSLATVLPPQSVTLFVLKPDAR